METRDIVYGMRKAYPETCSTFDIFLVSSDLLQKVERLSSEFSKRSTDIYGSLAVEKLCDLGYLTYRIGYRTIAIMDTCLPDNTILRVQFSAQIPCF